MFWHRFPAAFLCVFVGGGLGACLRYALGLVLDPLLAPLLLGTITANLVGAYLAGIAAAFFLLHADLAPAWRLLAMTGFLGGLTTFSAFSVEMAGLLQSGRMATAVGGIALHVLGSLALTLLGVWTVRSLFVAH
jgi:fluoride exporter